MELRMAVSKSYGPFRLDADFSVQGERIGIFGESGSGKSTLIGMLAGLVEPDDGTICLEGETLFSRGEGVAIPTERRRIAMVFQQPSLFPHLSVRNNLLYGYNRCASQHRRVEFDPLVQVLKLEGLLDRGVNNLSGGEQQRVAIGRAVMASPRLLVMDEPLSALDDDLKFQIIPYLTRVCGQFGIPFIFISHSLLEMRLMTDTVLMFDKGRLVEQGSADELARRRMGLGQVGYINLLRLGRPVGSNGLHTFAWGGGKLLLSAAPKSEAGLYELSSRDIILFKQHPEAISARNLLKGLVVATFESGSKTGVELACGSDRLIAEVVHEAAAELDIRPGGELYAAIKASAFRPLG
ncbi:molybdenum ABC transporter ATP-binding protein [Geomobilimonas luticola]|uniref:Molybdenum ABC transporter ATP-binding protein n=1 Tax=Geomobilimonas luticola TaxID=1114878 RepID=A0ABS5SFX4_9BACT|nr:molybdenum ABC transporter ATP-binding protein [Geomobilimonas luticola]MBT0653567.1 molybdenum ABC transporter ATP-binding protein [Geomobilimonas luticola]